VNLIFKSNISKERKTKVAIAIRRRSQVTHVVANSTYEIEIKEKIKKEMK